MTIKERGRSYGVLSPIITRKAGDHMKGGFSFCGINVADIGLEYAPDNDKTYVYAPGATSIHEQTFDSHEGGYYYGAAKQPKEFVLRCFYEDKYIAKGLMANVYGLFKIGKTGLLVFDRRPWCYYYATVTNVDISNLHSYLNGLVVITMKAYYPLARGLELKEGHLYYNLLTDPYHTDIMQNTALLDKDIAPQTSYEGDIPNKICLYNPGTERASVGIVISGTSSDNGVVIENTTTGQTCRYHALSSDVDYIYTDGINGKTVSVTDGVKSLGFLYHDYGFIDLEPAFPIKRNIFAMSDGTVVKTTNILYSNPFEQEWYKDKYIYLSNAWHKIQECTDKNTITLYEPVDYMANYEQTSIVLMNELVIQPEDGTEISKISFIYKPTFA